MIKKRSIFTILFLLFSFLCEELYSQSKNDIPSTELETQVGTKTAVSFSIGPSMFFHLRDKDSENEFIPDEFEVLNERPSVASFYNSRVGIRTEIAAKVQKDLILANIIYGLSYEYQLLMENNDYEVDVLLGEKLNLHMFHPFIGLSYESDINSINSFIKVGPSFRKYFGNASDSSVDLKQNYNLSTGIRISGGFNSISSIKSDQIIIGIELGIDLGTLVRDDIDFLRDGKKVARAEIKGAESMRDYIVAVSLSVGYNF